LHRPKRVQFRIIRGSGPLPSIEVEPSFQDITRTADPAKIKEQLRHANEQLELTRQRYPGRERAQPLGKVIETRGAPYLPAPARCGEPSRYFPATEGSRCGSSQF
jgi:hypothetical protein